MRTQRYRDDSPAGTSKQHPKRSRHKQRQTDTKDGGQLTLKAGMGALPHLLTNPIAVSGTTFG